MLAQPGMATFPLQPPTEAMRAFRPCRPALLKFSRLIQLAGGLVAEVRSEPTPAIRLGVALPPISNAPRILICSKSVAKLPANLFDGASEEEAMSSAVANTETEWLAMLANKSVDIVRNMEDWRELLERKDRPLSSVPPDIMSEFTRGLLFKGLGLAHADYGMLLDYLPQPEIDKLWEVFGIGPGLLKDYNNYWCGSRATCNKKPGSICTANCVSSG
jgi:hypothetical protein